MTTTNSNERLMRFLQATPEQQAAIDRILEGKPDVRAPAPTGPLLIGTCAAAALLGISRATLWRMVKAGRLSKVEILPGSFRLRRADVEAIVAGPSRTGRGEVA